MGYVLIIFKRWDTSDKNYQKFDFNEISVADLEIISGGSGSLIDSFLASTGVGAGGGSLLGIMATNTARGAATGGAVGAAAGAAFGVGWAIGTGINSVINWAVYG